MSERILIVGAGAVGGLLAAYLAAGGKAVTVFARGANARNIEQNGIRLTLPDGSVVHGRPRVVERSDALERHDLVLLTTKAFSLAEALELARPAIGPATIVSPCVNGVPWWFGTPAAPIRAVDPDGALVRAIPAGRLVGSTIFSPVHRTADGQWVQSVAGRLTVGPSVSGGDVTAAARLAAAFDGCAYPAIAVPDVHRAVWTKLVANAAFNPICALTETRQADVARDAALGPTAVAIMHEIVRLAGACGGGIDGSPEAMFAQARDRGVHKPSMLQDFEAGRRIELAAIVDAPLELAARHGVEMPMLGAIGALVRLKARTAGLL